MSPDRVAQCTCGSVQALCRGEPARVSLCHCLACKRRTGSAFSWNATFLRDQVTTSGLASHYTRRSDEGRWCTFHFCPGCGATVFYEIEVRPGKVSIPVGAFAEPGFPEPTVSVHGRTQESWVACETLGPFREE